MITHFTKVNDPLAAPIRGEMTQTQMNQRLFDGPAKKQTCRHHKYKACELNEARREATEIGMSLNDYLDMCGVNLKITDYKASEL